jgi:predicted nucleic-acid-binding Zn-ribbon protein
MGQICIAQCNCGFNVEVTVGGGMRDFEKRSYFPHYCSRCGLVSVNVCNRSIECPKCGGKDVIAYGDKSITQGSSSHSGYNNRLSPVNYEKQYFQRLKSV